MSDTPYKLQIKIGAHEFSAEGPEATVKEAFDAFMKAVTNPAPAAAPIQGQLAATLGGVMLQATGTVTDTAPIDLNRVFKQEGDIISMKHLPPTPNKIADAAIVLMYGYMKLANIDDVPVTKLNEGLRRSGLNLARLDRELGVHHALYRKGGQKSGGRFTLNNQGVLQAEAWLREWA